MTIKDNMLFQTLLFTFFFSPTMTEMISHHYRRHISSSLIKLDFTANAVYNKLYQRSLNLNNTRIINLEPRNKVWFGIENDTIYALPLFGDYPGPFKIHLENPQLVELKLKFDFAPSTSLFSPSNHLLLALFNISSVQFHQSLINRYFLVQTLSLALNISDNLLTIHKINGTMIKVYFSCDFYTSTNLVYEITTLINNYYSKRLQLIKSFPLPLLEISIIRLSNPMKTTNPLIDMKKGVMTIRPRSSTNNKTSSSGSSTMISLIHLEQFYQPLVLIPLIIIIIGLIICTIIAFCLCCNRRSTTSSSTLLLPGNPNNKYLYENYSYKKHRKQQEIYRKKHFLKDQRQFISKGIPVVFAEELDEKLEQTHTPLVMRIEKPPYYHESEKVTF